MVINVNMLILVSVLINISRVTVSREDFRLVNVEAVTHNDLHITEAAVLLVTQRVRGESVGDTQIKTLQIDIGRVMEGACTEGKRNSILETVTDTTPIDASVTRQCQDFPLEGLEVSLNECLRHQLPIRIERQHPCVTTVQIKLRGTMLSTIAGNTQDVGRVKHGDDLRPAQTGIPLVCLIMHTEVKVQIQR